MSTKPVLEKFAEIQRSYVPLCGHTTFVLLTPACTISSIDIITIFCNDVDKTSTFVELMAINSLCYMSQRNSICLGIKLVAGLSVALPMALYKYVYDYDYDYDYELAI